MFFGPSPIFFYLYMFFGPGCILDVLRTWGKEIVADVLMCFLDPVGIIFVEFWQWNPLFSSLASFFGTVHLLCGPCWNGGGRGKRRSGTLLWYGIGGSHALSVSGMYRNWMNAGRGWEWVWSHRESRYYNPNECRKLLRGQGRAIEIVTHHAGSCWGGGESLKYLRIS